MIDGLNGREESLAEKQLLRRSKYMTKELKYEIKRWLDDFEKTQPGNLDIDPDTFEGSAYYLFNKILGDE